MLDTLANWLIAKAKRTPYFHLYHADGSLYMERYWLVPYVEPYLAARWYQEPFAWLLQQFGIAIRVHHIATADRDRHMHDHPWSFVSVVLRGWYAEKRPSETGYSILGKLCWRDPGSLAYRRATDRHSIVLVPVGGVWTLFITFRYHQTWGFYTEEGKVPYKTYLNQEENEHG